METQTDTRVIAWRLLAPSDSGGKVYTIAVIGDELFVCWGRADQLYKSYEPGSQSKVVRLPSHAAALAAAMERTVSKEHRGYEMDIPPKQLIMRRGIGANRTTVRHVLRDGAVV